MIKRLPVRIVFGKIRIQSLRSCQNNCGSPVGQQASSSLGPRMASASPSPRSLLPAWSEWQLPRGWGRKGAVVGRRLWWGWRTWSERKGVIWGQTYPRSPFLSRRGSVQEKNLGLWVSLVFLPTPLLICRSSLQGCLVTYLYGLKCVKNTVNGRERRKRWGKYVHLELHV